jgi:hypothetical protein
MRSRGRAPLRSCTMSFASGADWRDLGYTNDLKRPNRLVLIDARGHGASDKPHDPLAYDLVLRVSDVTSVLDDLQLPISARPGRGLRPTRGFSRYQVCLHKPHTSILIHSIVSAACASRSGGMGMPSSFAVLRFMVRSKRVGCATGKSPGFAPFRILSTYGAAPR